MILTPFRPVSPFWLSVLMFRSEFICLNCSLYFLDSLDVVVDGWILIPEACRRQKRVELIKNRIGVGIGWIFGTNIHMGAKMRLIEERPPLHSIPVTTNRLNETLHLKSILTHNIGYFLFSSIKQFDRDKKWKITF